MRERLSLLPSPMPRGQRGPKEVLSSLGLPHGMALSILLLSLEPQTGREQVAPQPGVRLEYLVETETCLDSRLSRVLRTEADLGH